MKHVVFVAPYLLPATLRFLKAAIKVPNVRLSLIGCFHPMRLPPDLRPKISGHFRINQAFDPGQIAVAARALSRKHGTIHRLFGPMEELQVPLARVREYLGIEGLGTEAALNFRDKSRMKDLLRQNQVPCAQHCLMTHPKDAWAFVERVGFPVIVKPPEGAGARNTFRVETEQALRDYLSVSQASPARPILLEEFVQGDEYSFETVSIKGKPVWYSLSRYYPNPLEVLQNPWIQWCVLLPRETDHQRFADIRRDSQKALQALGMTTGLSHMEWFRRKNGSLAISEVGARPPGAQFMTLMSHAHGKDFYAAWAQLMMHDTFQPPTQKYAAGAAYLRGMGHGQVKAVHGVEQAARELGSLVMEARLPKVGQPSSTSYEGEGYVLVRHEKTEIVKKALQRLVSLIRVEYV